MHEVDNACGTQSMVIAAPEVFFALTDRENRRAIHRRLPIEASHFERTSGERGFEGRLARRPEWLKARC